jgi:hypothetical protein
MNGFAAVAVERQVEILDFLDHGGAPDGSRALKRLVPAICGEDVRVDATIGVLPRDRPRFCRDRIGLATTGVPLASAATTTAARLFANVVLAAEAYFRITEKPARVVAAADLSLLNAALPAPSIHGFIAVGAGVPSRADGHIGGTASKAPAVAANANLAGWYASRWRAAGLALAPIAARLTVVFAVAEESRIIAAAIFFAGLVGTAGCDTPVPSLIGNKRVIQAGLAAIARGLTQRPAGNAEAGVIIRH